MARKGERQPYRVEYQYPGGKKNVSTFARYDSAERTAGEIGRNGGVATVVDATNASMVVEMATFGPSALHLFEWYNANSPRLGLYCRCGRRTHNDDDARNHMHHAGLCWDCWGTGLVSERATRDGGLPMAGNLIHCPVCGGSGRDSDVSYHDVDIELFYNRLTELRLKR